jgi:hypothetical protein
MGSPGERARFPLNKLDHFEKAREEIARRIATASELDALNANPYHWAAGLAAELRIKRPELHLDRAVTEDLGEIEVDCSEMAGIASSPADANGQVIRPGTRLRLVVPATEGELLLALGQPLDPAPGRDETNDQAIVQQWDWPHELGGSALGGEIESFKAALAQSAEQARRAVEDLNHELEAEALAQIEERRRAILARREFLGDLTIPVVAREDAPVPPIADRTSVRDASAAEMTPPHGSQLDDLYEQILQHIRTMGHALERAPASYAGQNEEMLRDHFLLILNTHFEGQTYAEAFNKHGRTDILIRVEDKTVFIAECKWWSGGKAMESALAQLSGYATWRDLRLALIFFVGATDVAAVVDAAQSTLERRGECSEISLDEENGELRCAINWPASGGLQANLAVQFFHLPR